MMIKAAHQQQILSKFYQRVYFSISKNDKDEEFTGKLSAIKQRALISYYTLEFIMLFNNKTFKNSSDSIR